MIPPPPMISGDKVVKKKQRDLLITAALLAVLLFLFLKNTLLNKKPESPSPAPEAAASRPIPNMADELVYLTNLRLNDKVRMEQEKVWEKEWGRDPFQPVEESLSIQRAVNLTLNGVLWDEKKPRAIVNEKTLRVGDTIYGYTVVDIRPQSVILQTGEKILELRVFGPAAVDSA